MSTDPTRIIMIMTPEWLDTFAGFTTQELGPVTFDLARLLSPGEVILGINSFVLTVARNSAAQDPAPNSRLIGTPRITGTRISQRFGNWQPDVALIVYRVRASVATSNQRTNTCAAFLPVQMTSAAP